MAAHMRRADHDDEIEVVTAHVPHAPDAHEVRAAGVSYLADPIAEPVLAGADDADRHFRPRYHFRQTGYARNTPTPASADQLRCATKYASQSVSFVTK